MRPRSGNRPGHGEASQPAAGAPCCTQTAPPRESPGRQLVCHSRARRRPYRQLAPLPDSSSALPAWQAGVPTGAIGGGGGWMIGTAISKARPPESCSRQRRRHGHAARTDHPPRGRPGGSNQAPSPAHTLGPNDHLSEITLAGHSSRPRKDHRHAPPPLPAGHPPPVFPVRRPGRPRWPPTLPPGRTQNQPICAPPATPASGSPCAPTRRSAWLRALRDPGRAHIP